MRCTSHLSCPKENTFLWVITTAWGEGWWRPKHAKRSWPGHTVKLHPSRADIAAGCHPKATLSPSTSSAFRSLHPSSLWGQMDIGTGKERQSREGPLHSTPVRPAQPHTDQATGGRVALGLVERSCRHKHTFPSFTSPVRSAHHPSYYLTWLRQSSAHLEKIP